MMQARSIVVPVALAALTLGGLVYANGQGPATVAYVTAAASQGTITQTFVASGTVDRAGRRDLTFDAPGTVASVAVNVGDLVKAGDTLAALDPAPLQVAVLQARAALAQAEAVRDADQTALDNGGSRPLPSGALPSTLPSGTRMGTRPAARSDAGTSPTFPAGGMPTNGSSVREPGATPPYATELERSLGTLQRAATQQQRACAPVFKVAGQLDGLRGELPAGVTGQRPTGKDASSTPTSAATTARGFKAEATPTNTAPSAPPAQTSGTPTRSPARAANAPRPTASPTTRTKPSATPSPTEVEPSSTASPTVRPSPSRSATPPPRPTQQPRSSGRPDVPVPSVGLPAGALPSVDASQVTRIADQLRACTAAMGELAAAQSEAGQAILTASQAMQQATQDAQAQLAAAQEQMVASAEAAGRQAAAEAMADAQAKLAEQAARAAGGTVTEATLAADEAAVLQAEQTLDQAQRRLDEATMVAPASGTVGAVTLKPGENSSGRSITLIGDGAAEVPVEIPLAQRALVTTGAEATVGLVGGPRELTGRVTSVSVLPTEQTGDPTYTATVTVDDPALTLKPGSKAEAHLPLRRATGVLTVPLSAVTKTSATAGTVRVVSDPSTTTAETVPVTTGAYGGGRLEITSGLKPGDLVVLADRREPVPGGMAQYAPRSAAPSPTPTRR